MKRSIISGAALIALVLCTVSSAAAEDEIRSRIRDSWLAGEIDSVHARVSETMTDRYGSSWTISQKNDGAGMLVVTVSPDERTGFRGLWSLSRRLTDGMPDRIRTYPLPDSRIYFEMRPDGDNPERGKSLVSLSIYGAWVSRDVPVGLPLVALYTLTLQDIRALTPRTIPWDLLSPDPDRYRDVASAVSVIRGRLDTLVYLDDGAFDENGDPVLIETGAPQSPAALRAALAPGQDPAKVIGGVNCSGFAKWIVDGIIRPSAGTGLYIEPLKKVPEPLNSAFNDDFRERRDLFFGLDWTRNLASAAVSLRQGYTVKPNASGVDVTLEALPGRTGYERDIGYRAADIMPLLYVLAVRESGHMYLGAISRERGAQNLREYHHIAAFFPYFDDQGQFTVAIFESARETACEPFFRANSDAWIHLVRVRLPESGYFEP